MPKTVPVRFLIISDTHTQPLDYETSARAFRHPLPKADVLLHCGDLTTVGNPEEYEETLRMLSAIDAELKLVIAGNHDLTLDRNYRNKSYSVEEERERQDKAYEIWTGAQARKAGVTYLDEGHYTFSLKNGAFFSVYASQYTPAFCNWGFPYLRPQDRFNPAGKEVDSLTKCIAEKPIPDFPHVDILMTHGPPRYHRSITASNTDAGCKHLLNALTRSRPRMHCFGHIHEAWGVELLEWTFPEDKTEGPEQVVFSKSTPSPAIDGQYHVEHLDVSSQSSRPLKHGQQTLLVNAAIMDIDYEPTNAPWLVDLDLPVAE